MDRLIYLSMTGAKATLQRQDVLAQQPGQRVDRPASAPSCRPSAPCRCAATARARASTRSSPRSATTPRPAPVQSTGRSARRRDAGQRPGSRCRRWTAPRPTPAPARCEVDAEGQLRHAGRPAGAGRRRADHAAGQRRGRASASDGTVTHHGRPATGRSRSAGSSW
ncbi:MAG: hypothetical protein MZW92_72030 [Comamonadaceae bacterium]|nr:hypothetical protein [Comamonadaceae bacterium]